MGQHGFGSFAASVRSGGDLVSILEALQSGHIGTARPSYVEDGMVWHKHLPAVGVAGTIEKYFTFGGVDFLEGSFDLETGEYSGAGSVGVGPSVQVFTASGTWTRPDGVVAVQMYVTGGGGGSSNDGNPVGSNGWTSIRMLDVTGIASASITVGSAGATANNGSWTTQGGDSTFSGGGVTVRGGGAASNRGGGGAPIGGDLAMINYWGDANPGYRSQNGIVYIVEFRA